MGFDGYFDTATLTIEIYDALTVTGTPILSRDFTATTDVTSNYPPIVMETGLSVKVIQSSGTINATVYFRKN